MKTLYLECGMGAAGDMLMAALLELIPDRQSFLDQMNALGLPGVQVGTEPSVKCGIRTRTVTVIITMIMTMMRIIITDITMITIIRIMTMRITAIITITLPWRILKPSSAG